MSLFRLNCAALLPVWLSLTCLFTFRFVAAGRQLAKRLESPSLNDTGFSKRYVRSLQVGTINLGPLIFYMIYCLFFFVLYVMFFCYTYLQISEIVNSMKGFMDFCGHQNLGPIGNYCDICSSLMATISVYNPFLICSALDIYEQ